MNAVPLMGTMCQVNGFGECKTRVVIQTNRLLLTQKVILMANYVAILESNGQ
jgi:hypothetical protein